MSIGGSYITQRVYAKIESAFNDTTYTGLAAGDALVPTTVALQASDNRVPSKSKRGTPDVVASLPRMQTSGFQLGAEWRPSGTIGVESDLGPLLKAFFGTQTLSGSGSGVATTVSASPTPTVTGCTVASATGMSVGDLIYVTLASGRREATRIKTIATNALTFDALSAAPASGAAVVDSVTYKLQTAVPSSICVANFLAGKKECITGGMVESIELNFGKQDEVTVTINGQSAQYRGNSEATSLTDPVTSTTVGSPINGLTASAVINGAAFTAISAKVTLANAIKLRDQDMGAAYATEAYRSDFRMGTFEVTFYVDDHAVVNLGESHTKVACSLSIGSTNGSMLGFVAPNVEFDRAPLPSGTSDAPTMTVRGTLYGSTTGNDALFVGE